MKKILLTLALATAVVSTFAQGKVTFGNDSTRVFTLGSAVLGEDAEFAGQALPISGLASGNLSAILYAGTTADSLALQTAVTLAGADLPVAGRMANKSVTLNAASGVLAGTTGYFQIIIVDSTAAVLNSIVGGADRSAFDGAKYFGTTGLFTALAGAAPNALYNANSPVNSTWAPGPVIISAVPEPSSMALAGVGAVSLLIFRRRK